MKIIIEDYRLVDKGPIVETDITPTDVRRFKTDAPSLGSTSIVYCGRKVPIDCNEGKPFTLAPDELIVLNVGATHKTYLVFDDAATTAPQEPVKTQHTTSHPRFHGSDVILGDSHFKESLPPHLKELGLKFLKMIRERFDGELRFHTKSKKYVETPNNFWAVVIQPRDRSLRVTVKGRPNSFVIPSDLTLKPDLSSYSAFKVKDESQLDSAIRIITEAASN